MPNPEREQEQVRAARIAPSTSPKAASPKVSQAPAAAACTHEQIAECAYMIWLQKGKPSDQDEVIWCAAEASLAAQDAQPAAKSGTKPGTKPSGPAPF